MFEVPTTLVLGAGASCHYGYPTGDGLIWNIKKTIFQNFTDFVYSPPEEFQLNQFQKYQNLHDKLELFDPLSIDSFLGQNHSDQDLVDAGKTLIAYQIITSEDPRKLLSSHAEEIGGKKHRGNWYRFLLNALFSPNPGQSPQSVIDDLCNPEIPLQLKIITFNYDISLEYFLYSRIQSAEFLGKGKDILWNKINDNIVHIYGAIGADKRKLHQYGMYGDFGPEAVRKRSRALDIAKQWKDTIHVIGEERGKDYVKSASAKAQDWLRNSQKVFFLGYGFNAENNALLKLKETCEPAAKIYLTNHPDLVRLRDVFDKMFVKKITDGYMPARQHPNQIYISTNKIYQALEGEFSFTSIM